jgi:hypothetical protein
MSTEDKVLHHLPRELQVLNILALLHNSLTDNHLNHESFGFSPLDVSTAFRVIEKAARLPNLVELTLALVNPPSLSMFTAIADSCPNLRILELAEVYHRSNPYQFRTGLRAFVRAVSRSFH